MSDHPEPAYVLVQWDLSDYSRHYANTERAATLTSLLIGGLLAGGAVIAALKFAEYPLAAGLGLAAIWCYVKPDFARRRWLKKLPDYYFAPYTYYLEQDGIHFDTTHERRMIRWQVIDSVVLGLDFWHVTGKVRGLHIPHRYMTDEQMVVMRQGFRRYHQEMAAFPGRSDARLALGDEAEAA